MEQSTLGTTHEIGWRQTTKAEVNVTSATDKHSWGFLFLSPESALDCGKACGTASGRSFGIDLGKACGMDSGKACGMDSGKACRMDPGKACGMSDSPVSNGNWLEVVPEVVAFEVRFFDTARHIQRILGCSSDFRMLGSLSPHMFW